MPLAGEGTQPPWGRPAPAAHGGRAFGARGGVQNEQVNLTRDPCSSSLRVSTKIVLVLRETRCLTAFDAAARGQTDDGSSESTFAIVVAVASRCCPEYSGVAQVPPAPCDYAVINSLSLVILATTIVPSAITLQGPIPLQASCSGRLSRHCGEGGPRLQPFRPPVVTTTPVSLCAFAIQCFYITSSLALQLLSVHFPLHCPPQRL